MAKRKVVVVDGSNLATEGRSVPSLKQLEESVKAFIEEFPTYEVIVVVDATFEHRVAKEERARFKEAELNGEVVTPPAGAVGRGDAFILKIATRADAIVLSNDSFQEFHAEYPWLFEEGRLLGGKPIAGVGWIFTPRNPVRGPKSRAVRARAASTDDGVDEERPKIGAVRAASSEPAKATRRAAAARPTAKAAAKAPARAKAPTAVRPARAKDTKPAPAAVEPKPKRTGSAAKATVAASDKPAKSTTTSKAPAASRSRTTKAPADQSPRAAKAPARATSVTSDATKATKAASASKSRATEQPAKRAAGGAAPSTSKVANGKPVNSPRAFEALVDGHPLKSTVEGTVTTFTSHGAMITIQVGRGVEVVCYAPLAGLAKPAPTRARDVLKKGERRKFRIVAYDTKRRIAELTLVAR